MLLFKKKKKKRKPYVEFEMHSQCTNWNLFFILKGRTCLAWLGNEN